MRRRHSTFFEELGPGGLSTLLLALATAVGGLGVPVVVRLREVLKASREDQRLRSDAILVLGRELVDDRPSAVFSARLAHGARLWREGWAPEIIVSGGWTGRATRSEAEAGREALIERGVPGSVIRTEDRSRHTLENLFFVREALAERGLGRLLLVSDPLHLARASAFARGLSLDLVCSPAEAATPRRNCAVWWVRAIREAFLLHWYRVGMAFSRAIGSERMLARVT